MTHARAMQVHLIPRSGKAKDGEAVKVFEAASKFTFHLINAWETDTDCVVLDVLGRDVRNFALDLDNLPVSTFECAERLTSVRRMVLQHRSGKCKEYDLRDSSLLRWRDFELPSTPPHHYTCKSHEAVFGMVRLKFGLHAFLQVAIQRLSGDPLGPRYCCTLLMSAQLQLLRVICMHSC